jgi:hypothetical protein
MSASMARWFSSRLWVFNNAVSLAISAMNGISLKPGIPEIPFFGNSRKSQQNFPYL